MDGKGFVWGVMTFLFLLTLASGFVFNIGNISTTNPIEQKYLNLSPETTYATNAQENIQNADDYLQGSVDPEDSGRSALSYISGAKDQFNTIKSIGEESNSFFNIDPRVIRFVMTIILIGLTFAIIGLGVKLIGGIFG